MRMSLRGLDLRHAVTGTLRHKVTNSSKSQGKLHVGELRGGGPNRRLGHAQCAVRITTVRIRRPVMNRGYLVTLSMLFCFASARADDATILLKPDRVFDGATATPHAGW